jgi:hypothetical protein
MGLDWMIVTDHSFDLNPAKWAISSADCDAHSDGFFRILQGEEVSCYLPGTEPISQFYQYNHLLVYGADFIPGGEWEDGTGSDYTPAEAIAIANSQGGLTYFAHPFYDDPFRDPWRAKDYNLSFTGLQIWNYGSDIPSHLRDGLAKWSELLLGGRHVYVEGGTDAHGDFNTIAGKVKTYIYVPGYSQSSLPPRTEIIKALRNGNSVMSDGPLVIFDINGAIIGNNVSVTKGTNATLSIQWNSTPEFGGINNIVVKKGVINGTAESNFRVVQPSAIGKNAFCDEYKLTISPDESCYYRVEANTTNGAEYRCYTNPVWVEVIADSTAPVFDTGESTKPYPGIAGTHNGTITLNQTISVQKLYTYPCAGTGGHTEYARIWNSTLEVNATWDGYKEDWHNVSFDEPFTLVKNETYNYTIRTGSYPQIHHTAALLTANGWVNCTEFTDANGKRYSNWIPAVKLLL